MNLSYFTIFHHDHFLGIKQKSILTSNVTSDNEMSEWRWKKGVEKMSNSPLKVMIFERPSKGTDRVHPDEMQWEWLAEMEWKDWNMAYFNLFHAPNPGFLRNAKRYFGRSLSDPKRPGWFGNQSRKMPLTQEFTQKWVGPSQFFHKAYYYTSIFQRVLRGMLIKRTTYVNNLQILGTIQVHSRKLRVRT